MLYTLDTNIIIDIIRGNKEIFNKLKEINPEHLCVNPIILCELFKGAYKSNNPEASIILFEEIVKGLEIIEFNNETYHIYGKYFSELKRLGKPIQEYDLLIASLTIAHNTTLITKNIKDFKNIKGLKVIEF